MYPQTPRFGYIPAVGGEDRVRARLQLIFSRSYFSLKVKIQFTDPLRGQVCRIGKENSTVLSVYSTVLYGKPLVAF